jgi:uncharacterized protein
VCETTSKECVKPLELETVNREKYVERLLDRPLEELLSDVSAVMINGPRATGKTTSARRVAQSVLQLDRGIEAAGVRADPDAVLESMSEPILIDEWQNVPEVLGAVKRLIDTNARPGRFILTGSARSDALTKGWPATGRVIRVSQWGITQRELQGDPGSRSLVDDLFEPEPDRLLKQPTNPPGLRDYLEMAIVGGFPESQARQSERTRRLWLDSYVEQLLTRDASIINERRDPRRLRRYLQALASNTAGIVEHKTIFESAGISRDTALAYDGMLDLLMVTEQVGAWSSNRLNRLARAPKRYLTEPSLMVPLLGVNTRSILRNGDLMGRLIDSFVVAQLRPELGISETMPTINHLRLEDGRREIDILLEAPDGRVVGIEIKAGAEPDGADAKHLIWLREQLGDQFATGVVFHTGPHPYALSENIYALPIATLWN